MMNLDLQSINMKQSKNANNIKNNIKELISCQEFEKAATLCDKLISNSHNCQDNTIFCSYVYIEARKFEKAEYILNKAISTNNQCANYYTQLGIVKSRQKKWKSAIEHLKTSISLDNSLALTHNNLGTVYKELHKFKKAESCFMKAISLENNHIYLFNLGSLQRIMGKFQEAITNLLLSIELTPSFINSYNDLGIAYSEIGQFENARIIYQKALSIDPNFPETNQNMGILNLTLGEFELGWPRYKYRLRSNSRGPSTTGGIDKLNSLANFSSPGNKNILILPEQGIGDEIMFSSIINDLLKSNKGEITLVCDSRLTDIFQRTFPTISVTGPKGVAICDGYEKIYIGCLAKIFRNSFSDFKPNSAYISPKENLKQHFKNKYKHYKGLRIGIAWKSGNLLEGNKRSIPLNHLQNILSIPNCNFINLQYGSVQHEIGEFSAETKIDIINDAEVDQMEDLENFIALISSLDLVITIDNSTAHFAGALGIPTWVMLPYNADWRWLRDRKDSIWYNSLRLYRQQEIGNWSNVIEEIAKDLTERNIQPIAEPKQPAASKPDSNRRQQQKKSVPKPPKNIALLNDTSEWYHWGCTATSSAIRKRIAQCGHGGIYVPINHTYNFKQFPQTTDQFESVDFFKQAFTANRFIYNAIEAADCIVINGEGSIHHLSPVSLTLLYIAFAAKKFKNKPVHIINHSPYPDNAREARDDFAFQLYRSIYNQLDYVAIREHISHKLMTDYGTQAELSFDCLPITVTEDYSPENLDSNKNIVIAGSVSFTKDKITDLEKLMVHFSQQGYKIKILMGAKAFPAQDDVNFVQELMKLKFKKFEVIDAKSLTEWLDCLNSASVFVSGRFHHSLAAIYLETPCVMMESNTFKNVAIAETFNMPDPIRFDSDNFFEELLERTEKAIGSDPVDSELRKQMLARSEVNFAGLKELG